MLRGFRAWPRERRDFVAHALQHTAGDQERVAPADGRKVDPRDRKWGQCAFEATIVWLSHHIPAPGVSTTIEPSSFND